MLSLRKFKSYSQIWEGFVENAVWSIHDDEKKFYKFDSLGVHCKTFYVRN
jgi:hypothetical protein